MRCEETYEIRDVKKYGNSGYDALRKCDAFPYCETKKLHNMNTTISALNITNLI